MAIIYFISTPLGGSTGKILQFDSIILDFSSKYGYFRLHLTAKGANPTQALNIRSQKLHQTTGLVYGNLKEDKANVEVKYQEYCLHLNHKLNAVHTMLSKKQQVELSSCGRRQQSLKILLPASQIYLSASWTERGVYISVAVSSQNENDFVQ